MDPRRWGGAGGHGVVHSIRAVSRAIAPDIHRWAPVIHSPPVEPVCGRWSRSLGSRGRAVPPYDFAPVADVVPRNKQSSNAPIGKLNRNFGNDVTAVSRSVVEFTQGMQDETKIKS